MPRKINAKERLVVYQGPPKPSLFLPFFFLLLFSLYLMTASAQDSNQGEPDCTQPLPMYLRFPHTYFYHLKSDENVAILASNPFPKIDDGWFRNRWTLNQERDGTQWVLRGREGSKEEEEKDTFGYRHHPIDTTLVSEEQKASSIEEGKRMYEAFKQLKDRLFNMNIKLHPTHPSFIHGNFTYRKQEVEKTEDVGYTMNFATKNLKNKMSLPKMEIELLEEEEDDEKICAQLGTDMNEVVCDARAKYRTDDGTCNNLFHPKFGSSFSPFRRMLPPEYGDEVSSPKVARDGTDLPNARKVSLALKEFVQRMSSCFSVLQMSFGQFIDHDLTSTPAAKGAKGSVISCCDRRVLQDPSLRHPECLPISIAPDDPFYGAYGVKCMEFVRSIPANKCRFGARQQINQVTAYVDGSGLYGSTTREFKQLREFSGGRMKMQTWKSGHSLLSSIKGDEDGCNDPKENSQGKFCFRAGDARVNEHLLLTFITTLFAWEHNRLAKELQLLHRDWEDERLFREAKRINSAQIQHITYNEFLPAVLSPALTRELDLQPLTGKQFYMGYDDAVDAGIASEFSAAAFRFGHSMIPTSFFKMENDGKVSATELNEVIFHPYEMFERNLSSIIHGAMAQSVGIVDAAFTNQITDKLFQMKNNVGLDLVALNIQRGRDHGLGGYTEARRACGFPKVTSFADLTSVFDSKTIDMMRKLYKYVEDIDLFLGGVSEKPLSGGLIGPTLGCIIAEQFIRVKKGDRFWYENKNQPGSFTPEQLEELHSVSLARIICNNVPELKHVLRWPLQLVGAYNPLLSCDSLCIPDLDLSKWK